MICPCCLSHYRKSDIEDAQCSIDPDLGVVCRVRCPSCDHVTLARQVTIYVPLDERRETDRT